MLVQFPRFATIAGSTPASINAVAAAPLMLAELNSVTSTPHSSIILKHCLILWFWQSERFLLLLGGSNRQTLLWHSQSTRTVFSVQLLSQVPTTCRCVIFTVCCAFVKRRWILWSSVTWKVHGNAGRNVKDRDDVRWLDGEFIAGTI